ncbi:MAG: hypothetical protein ACRD1X_22120 [Vicinamibacteria bacterium]
MSTVGEIRDRIIDFAENDDVEGFKLYLDTELLEIYDIEPRGGLAADLRGLLWALAKGKGWDSPPPKRPK